MLGSLLRAKGTTSQFEARQVGINQSRVFKCNARQVGTDQSQVFKCNARLLE